MSRSLRRINAVRCVSLIRPNVSNVVPTQIAQKLDVEPVFGLENQTLESKFKTLGTPATLCSASLPASLPLYVRRGCIVSLHNAQDLHIEHNWLGVTWSMVKYGSWRPALFHKLISPRPFNALVAPNVNHSRLASWFGISSQPFRTLCLLTLDGSQDWYVFGENSLIGYEGNTSLDIKNSGFFSARSSALPNAYRVLQGRGNALLSGAGSVYTIELSDECDELILKSEHLLAISSKNALDARNSVSEYRLTSPNTSKEISKPSFTDSPAVSPESEHSETFGLKQFGQVTSSAFIAVWNWTKHVYTVWVNGRAKYLKIRGPRSLLVQSSHNVLMPATQTSQPVLRNHIAEKPLSIPALNSKDYLSYVTVRPDGKVEFKSTQNFDSRVAEIESSNRRV
ncbi:LAME_0E02938g1_1 [Lachancea meyersii CBS 8951]|uniref:Altered inheritance of mitochondria protein 24, mitochondrial n=1 Tax=Lachancea meyersii CBS 8951 TaxID=1266667 RepID=A0A1G4JGK7_9SACH|nr:LAME_0E02938g1_1 [Lachancea meyersii CBS 8951]